MPLTTSPGATGLRGIEMVDSKALLEEYQRIMSEWWRLCAEAGSQFASEAEVLALREKRMRLLEAIGNESQR